MKTILMLLAILLPCEIFAQTIFEDKVFDPDIKSAYLYPTSGSQNTNLKPAVIPLSQNVRLLLTFDEINTDEAAYYYAKVIHCDADWSKSSLSDMEYLYDFNEYFIENYSFSANTKVNYTQFTFTVPKVKLSGNYILKVYPENDPEHPILTKKFIAYENKISISPTIERSSGINERITNHQLNFSISYGSFPIPNPHNDVKVVIRQNFRWDNAIDDLKPTFVRPDISELEYRYFDLSNNFEAGNEYRFFDMRSILYSGQNVAQITQNNGVYQATLYNDKIKGSEVYGQYSDYDGGFIIENKDKSQDFLEADYVRVHFNLKMDYPIDDDIYIAGRLTNYKFNEDTKMVYNPNTHSYQNSLLLKQGWYDYIYYVPSQSNPYTLEGSYFETENNYDIIVYYTHPQYRYDLVIGYWQGSN